MLWAGRSGTDYGYGTLLRDSDAITLFCETHREVLATQFAQVRDKCVTITQPATIKMSEEGGGQTRAKSRQQLGQQGGAPLLVYYGYIYPNKGIETLLESFRLIANTFDKARLLMLGGVNEVVLRATNRPNYLQELRELAKESGIAEKVIWTDYFPTESDEPSVLLRAADVCILPFDDGISMHRSTFGVVASHQLPVVTTRGRSLEAPFIDRANVMLCPPKDAQALSRAVTELLEDRALQERLRDGTRELAKKYFSWDNCIAQRMALLRGQDSSALVGQ
jgi:glycosyltransferase involved in cell wall biosynthesis